MHSTRRGGAKLRLKVDTSGPPGPVHGQARQFLETPPSNSIGRGMIRVARGICGTPDRAILKWQGLISERLHLILIC
eukprot:368016-Amphidinium_carterae.1